MSFTWIALLQCCVRSRQTYQSRWSIWLSGAWHRPGLTQAEKHLSMSESYSSVAMETFLPCLVRQMWTFVPTRCVHNTSKKECFKLLPAWHYRTYIGSVSLWINQSDAYAARWRKVRKWLMWSAVWITSDLQSGYNQTVTSIHSHVQWEKETPLG